MKKLTCSVCGTHVETAETDDMVMDQMWAHMKSAHVEETEKMSAMPQEEQDKMKAEARAKITDES